MGKHGYYTGELVIPPYLSQNQICIDCSTGELPATRRPGRHSYYIIPASAIEAYYRSKEFIPEDVILAKLKELKINQHEEIVKNLLDKMPAPQRRKVLEEAQKA